MSSVRNFEEMELWQSSRELCNDIFQLAEREYYRRDWGLRQQMLDSSGSVMDNIAEGFERNGNKEFIQFLFIAKGSLGELRSQLIRSFDRKYLTNSELVSYRDKIKNIGSKLWNFISYLKSSEMKGIKYKD